MTRRWAVPIKISKSKKNRPAFRLKGLAAYLAPGILCVLFSLFIDIRFGVTFLVVYLLLPLVSIWLGIIAAAKIRLEAECSASVLGKGNTLNLRLKIECPLRVPFAYLTVHFLEPERIDRPGGGELVVALGRGVHIYETTYTARLCGPARCGVERAVVSDFLGFASREISGIEEAAATVRILPDILELRENQLLREALEVGTTEEEEETSAGSPLSSGVPGYEHRQYVPGDPFKRINWKLSAKRDVFMVRQPEPLSTARLTLLVDSCCPGVPEYKEGLAQAQILLEGVLAMARLVTRQSMECEVFYRAEKEWKSILVQGEKDLEALQYDLAGLAFQSGLSRGDRVPSQLSQGSGSLLVFTLQPDSDLYIGCIKGRDSGACRTIAPAGIPNPLPNGWSVDGDYIFSRKGG